MFSSQKNCSCCRKEKEKLLQCSNCKNAYYCDQKCQYKHWETHQYLCVEPIKSKDLKPPSKINEKTCFFAVKKENDLSFFITISHARDTYVPGKLTFQVEIMNNHPKNTYEIDVLDDSFILVLDGKKKLPKKFLPPVLKDGEMEEVFEEEEYQEFIQNENPRIISKNGIELDEIKSELKPSDQISCEFIFPIDLEFKYENMALSKCESFFVKLKKQEKPYEIKFNQEEVKKYYKDFTIGSTMINEKNKYPIWLKPQKKEEPKETPTQKEWKF
eukprot:gene3190-5506_t